jgi:hypothetical protein
MNKSSTREPNGTEHYGQLGETNGIACAQEVQILEYVWHIHAAQNAQKTQTSPVVVQINAYECWWNREKVNDRINVHPEP